MKVENGTLQKLKSKVLKMKGKPFLIQFSNGRKMRVAVAGIKGRNVVLKSVRKGKTKQFFGPFSFLLPLAFLLPFLFGDDFDFDDFGDFDFGDFDFDEITD